jgi:low affinity Fe/Cu permease
VIREWFHRFAQRTAAIVGSVPAFVAAVLVIVVWAVLGPVFHFSTTWQLVINTTTTIITFLIVFLIQNTQNRESRALNLKIDELLRASRSARTGFVKLEDMTDNELDHLKKEFEKLGGRIATIDDREREKRRATGAGTGAGGSGSHPAGGAGAGTGAGSRPAGGRTAGAGGAGAPTDKGSPTGNGTPGNRGTGGKPG